MRNALRTHYVSTGAIITERLSVHTSPVNRCLSCVHVSEYYLYTNRWNFTYFSSSLGAVGSAELYEPMRSKKGTRWNTIFQQLLRFNPRSSFSSRSLRSKNNNYSQYWRWNRCHGAKSTIHTYNFLTWRHWKRKTMTNKNDSKIWIWYHVDMLGVVSIDPAAN